MEKNFEIRFYLKDHLLKNKDNRYDIEWRTWRLGFGTDPVEVSDPAHR
jgi:hypothetical protein